jgi:hypothetical protein
MVTPCKPDGGRCLSIKAQSQPKDCRRPEAMARPRARARRRRRNSGVGGSTWWEARSNVPKSALRGNHTEMQHPSPGQGLAGVARISIPKSADMWQKSSFEPAIFGRLG